MAGRSFDFRKPLSLSEGSSFSEFPLTRETAECQGDGCGVHVRIGVIFCRDCLRNRKRSRPFPPLHEILGHPEPPPELSHLLTTIYFIGLVGDDHFVKIGKSNDTSVRLKELQVGNPFELRVLAAFEAREAWEFELHRSFAGYRVRGEWFLMNDRLARLIECLKDGDHRGAIRAIYEAPPAAEVA